MRAEGAASAYTQKERKKIIIRDPNQGGKDVTDEILRAKK